LEKLSILLNEDIPETFFKLDVIFPKLRSLVITLDAPMLEDKSLIYRWVAAIPCHLELNLSNCNMEDLIIFKYLNPKLVVRSSLTVPESPTNYNLGQQ
jgi:hypothetical protein